MTAIRIGQIVPTSNVTMETEIPVLMRAHGQGHPETFVAHSCRVRMTKVTGDVISGAGTLVDGGCASQSGKY